MAIEFRCSQCGRLLRTGDDTAGRPAQCPECGTLTTVPSPVGPQTLPPTPGLAPLGSSGMAQEHWQSQWHTQSQSPTGGTAQEHWQSQWHTGNPFASGSSAVRPARRTRKTRTSRRARLRPVAPFPYAQHSNRDTLAVVSLVLGIVGFPALCLCSILSLPVGATALGLGIYSLPSNNRGMAIAGMVLGAIQMALCVLAVAMFIGMAAFGDL